LAVYSKFCGDPAAFWCLWLSHQIAKSIGVSLYLSNENDFQQSDFPLFSKEVIVPNCKRPGMSDALICQKKYKDKSNNFFISLEIYINIMKIKTHFT